MSASALFMQLGATVLAGFAARKAISLLPGGPRAAERLRITLNRLVLWATMPALVFVTVHAAPLAPDLVQAPLAAMTGMAGTALVAWLLLGRLYGPTRQTGGLVLAASVGSVSFFGIPIVRALFGPEETRVAVYFAVLNVPLAILAAAIISSRIEPGGRGQTWGASLAGVAHTALRQFLTLPVTWALFAGLALGPVAVPAALQHGLKLAADSVAPTTMFALGLGLRFERTLTPYRMALPAALIKLAISPAVVFLCAWTVGLSGLPLAIVSLQGAMPTQVLGIVVAEQFRLDSRLVGLTLAMDSALAFVLLPGITSVIRATTGALA